MTWLRQCACDREGEGDRAPGGLQVALHRICARNRHGTALMLNPSAPKDLGTKG